MNEQEFDPKQYEMHIRIVENGYIVSCGCKTFIFNSLADFVNELRNYADGKTTDLTRRYFAQQKLDALRNEKNTDNCCLTEPCPTPRPY